MRRPLLWCACVVPLLLGGCLTPGQRVRTATLEMDTADGRWVLEDVGQATLRLSGWEVRITESAVSRHSDIPLLEKLILQVANTSRVDPLVIEPGDIVIEGFRAKSAVLTRPETVVLEPNQFIELRYDPGLRAPELPHPFIVRIRVYRSEQMTGGETVRLTLH